ncbi:amino acid permease [Nocardia sp. NPDC058058]|uniref:amino acid permease n=1 Tax=Nocardia sp. NPDC058058 TaxID=3346317 RepID=UPI0036D86DED
MTSGSAAGGHTSSAGKYLSTAALGCTTAAAIVTSLSGLPAMAEQELTMFFYIGFAVLLYLIPAGLVSAELGSAYSGESGGLYSWIGGAFGKRAGFAVMFLSWIQAMVFLPTGLSFAAAGVAFALDRPDLARDHVFVGVFAVVGIWLCTAIALMGNRFAARVTQAGFLIGTAVPGMVLIGLFGWWLVAGHPIGWEHTTDPAVTVQRDGHDAPRVLPALIGLSGLAFLGNILENFTGIESQAVHATELREPGRQYPIVILIAAVISAVLFSLGALAVAGIVPADRINLNSGVFDALHAGFGTLFGIGWPVLILGAMCAYGAIAGALAWTSGPSRGMLATARDGMLPPVLRRVNSRGVQTNILLAQAVAVTLLCTPYFVLGDVGTALFLIVAVAAGLDMIIYLFMYAAAIHLRYTRPDLPRPFRVPGGRSGMWFFAGTGFAAMVFALTTAFVPPEQLPIGSPALYVTLVAGGTVICCAIPILVERLRNPTWSVPVDDPAVEENRR